MEEERKDAFILLIKQNKKTTTSYNLQERRFCDRTSNITINNKWQLSMQSTSLAQGDQYAYGVWIDSLVTGTVYIGRMNYVSSGSIMVSNDIVFPGVSLSYSSRVWSITQNQVTVNGLTASSIIDTYYDENGFSYNILQHNFTRNLDTIVVNFQSGDIKKFVINELTADKLHITSIPDTNYIPVFDINGIYQDTVMMNLTSDNYFFDKGQ